MILNLSVIFFLFALSYGANYYFAPLYFQIDITVPILIFFAKDLKFFKFFFIVFFVIFMNALFERFAFTLAIYILVFSLLIFVSKKNFNIISIRYIFLASLTYMANKYLLVYLMYYKRLFFNGVVFLNIVFDVLINLAFSFIVFSLLEKVIFELRKKCEKALCSS
ncbi:MAG: hypothetical protein N2202_06150 [Proteobacteria bacterium]|nr:hypothetical protein [Pseudomonadota bacterium]